MIKKTNEDTRFLCENIAKLRKIHGLSKTAMAKRLGITVKSLENFESGKVPPRVSIRMLARIYTEFGIHPADIFHPICEADAKK